jgi:hypothetical protein
MGVRISVGASCGELTLFLAFVCVCVCLCLFLFCMYVCTCKCACVLAQGVEECIARELVLRNDKERKSLIPDLDLEFSIDEDESSHGFPIEDIGKDLTVEGAGCRDEDCERGIVHAAEPWLGWEERGASLVEECFAGGGAALHHGGENLKSLEEEAVLSLMQQGSVLLARIRNGSSIEGVIANEEKRHARDALYAEMFHGIDDPQEEYELEEKRCVRLGTEEYHTSTAGTTHSDASFDWLFQHMPLAMLRRQDGSECFLRCAVSH